MHEVVSSIDAVYIIIVYLFFAIHVGKITDRVFVKFFGTNYDDKSQMKLLLECSVQVELTAVIAYPCRKLISKIPFPFNGYHGYSRIQITELSPDATIIWSAFILAFEPSLMDKIKLLQKRMTNF